MSSIEGNSVHSLTIANDINVPSPIVKSWAVAWTKARCEKALVEYLNSRDVPSFLPLLVKRRVYGGRARRSLTPVFPGYVFFDSSSIDRNNIFASRHVAQILYPPDENQLRSDLRNLSIALKKDDALREARFGESGRPVTIKRGTLQGLCGELIRIGSNSRLIVRIHFLSRAAELEIDEALIDV
jgi:hypothetical protein